MGSRELTRDVLDMYRRNGFVTVAEAAREAGISAATIRRLVADNVIFGRETEGRLLVALSSVRREAPRVRERHKQLVERTGGKSRWRPAAPSEPSEPRTVEKVRVHIPADVMDAALNEMLVLLPRILESAAMKEAERYWREATKAAVLDALAEVGLCAARG